MIKYFVTRKFKGTCSSFEMLKGCMVRKRLGTPALRLELTMYEFETKQNIL